MNKNSAGIGFYCSSLAWGGLEMNLLRRAEWLSQRGWKTTVLCVENSPIDTEARRKSLNVINIRRNFKYCDIVNALRVERILKRNRINLLWIRDTRDISIASLVKRIFNVKVIYQQAMQIGVNKRDFFHTVRFSAIDAWISPLKFLANQVVKKTRFDAKKIHIVPLGVDVEKLIGKKISRSNARRILNVPDSGKIIGVIGRIDPLKGQLFLIEALRKLRDSRMNLNLLIVGEPTKDEGEEFFNFIKRRTHELNLDKNVFFRPFRKDVEIFYRAIDIFALPSKGETYGTVTIEAMIFGLPIIATDSGGTPEILEHGRLGFLYPPDDEEKFFEKIKWIVANEDEVKKIASLAKQTAREKYSHITECKKLEEIIEKL